MSIEAQAPFARRFAIKLCEREIIKVEGQYNPATRTWAGADIKLSAMSTIPAEKPATRCNVMTKVGNVYTTDIAADD